MANLTGLPIEAWRDMLKTPSALKRIDDFLKANTWYPISCGDTSRDLESGPLFTVDVQYHGPVEDTTTNTTNSQEEDSDAFINALRKQIIENVGVDIVAAPPEDQEVALNIHDRFLDYLYPCLDHEINPQQFEQMQRLMERMSALPKKHIIFTTPGRRNESVSSFLALWKQSIEKSEWKSHFFPEDAKLVVHQSKKRTEGPLVSGDPQYIFSMPASLKDLTDESPGTNEPHQGIDPVP